jgi:hypothetical protein
MAGPASNRAEPTIRRLSEACAFYEYRRKFFLNIWIRGRVLKIASCDEFSLREPPTLAKTRFPNFSTLNPLISSEPPKEMLGKNRYYVAPATRKCDPLRLDSAHVHKPRHQLASPQAR